MSEEFQEQDFGPEEPESAGARLKAAREAQGLRAETAAETLGLSRTVIVALEADDYARLGAPVYVRGYLRKYARYLDLPDDELVARYERGSAPHDPELKSRLTSVSPRPRSGGHWLAIVAILLLIVVLVVAGIWIWHYMRVMRQPGSIPPAAAAAASAVSPQVTPLHPVRARTTDGVAAAMHSAGPLGAVGAASAPRASSASAGVAASVPTHPQLTLHVRSSSWIEVMAADHTRLYYDLAPAGKMLQFNGKHGKLTVFLGNAPGVDVTVNGQPFSIPTANRSGSTARFKVALRKTTVPAGATAPGK
ncbi:MAG: helix-turn-helix domain-containing protein [Gammaproteobacteria bacterium]